MHQTGFILEPLKTIEVLLGIPNNPCHLVFG